MIACRNGHAAVAQLLLEYGADVNSNNPLHDCHTALAHAATQGNLECLRVLLRHGAELNDSNSRHKTALDILIQTYPSSQDHAACLRLLIESGARVCKPGEMSPLLRAAST